MLNDLSCSSAQGELLEKALPCSSSWPELYICPMSTRRKVLLTVLLLAVPVSVLWVRYLNRRMLTLVGVVITHSADPRKELPIAGVQVAPVDTKLGVEVTSDSSGLFKLRIRRLLLLRRRAVTLQFRHPNYEPLNLYVPVSNKITVAELTPIVPLPVAVDNVAKQTITNPVVRYSIKTATEENVGSAARSFEVANQANVPCNGAPLCSPDKKWKASVGEISLDAGTGNEFRNARASCIAGPCPFTRIETSSLEHPDRTLRVTATTWSQTATFLVEAEVVHPMVSDVVRYSYPVVFGNALNFTLPPAAESVSIQAEINGQNVIFPLGPALILSWANCNARSNPDETRVYRCELKPGYRWANAGG